MITYKSARSRPVSLGPLHINASDGIILDALDPVLEKLVEEGFLIVTRQEQVLEPKVESNTCGISEPLKPSFKLFK